MNNFSKLKKLIDICIAKEIAFVSFRLPDSQEVITYIQYKTENKTLNFGNLLANESGFVFAPFFEDEFHKKLLIEPDAIIINDDFDEALLIELANAKSEQTTENTNNTTTTTYEAYTQNVAHAIETIKAKKLEKVVISKTRIEALPENFEASSFYSTLLNNYPRAMVYFFQYNHQHCWLGASPEPLLLNEDNKYRTVSLAGTQAINESNSSIGRKKNMTSKKL
jgi:isochorismate synthase